MKRQEPYTSQSTAVSPSHPQKSSKSSSSCKFLCCTVFIIGVLLNILLTTILLFGVENYHKADPVQIYEVFETPKYAETNALIDSTQYLVLHGEPQSGILNFIEHEANLRAIEGEPVVLRQIEENAVHKQLKESRHFVELYLGALPRGRHTWFILLQNNEAPVHEIESLKHKYPKDSIILVAHKKLDVQGFSNHKFPALKLKQLKEFMQKDLSIESSEVKQILESAGSKDAPVIFQAYKSFEEAKQRARQEEAERLRIQQEEEERLRLEEEARLAAEKQAEEESKKAKKDKKSGKGKKGKAVEEETKEAEPEEQTPKKKKSSKKGKQAEAEPEVKEEGQEEPEPVKESKKKDKKSGKKQPAEEKVEEQKVKAEEPASQDVAVETPNEEVVEEEPKVEEKKGKGKKNKGKKSKAEPKVEVQEQPQPEEAAPVEQAVPATEEVKVEEVPAEPVAEQVPEPVQEVKVQEPAEEVKKSKGKGKGKKSDDEKQGKKGKKGNKKSKESPKTEETPSETPAQNQELVTEALTAEEPAALETEQTQ